MIANPRTGLGRPVQILLALVVEQVHALAVCDDGYGVPSLAGRPGQHDRLGCGVANLLRRPRAHG
jgi:hypothetical protein